MRTRSLVHRLPSAPPQSEDAIRLFLAQHCLTCHNARSGRLNLEALPPLPDNRAKWELVLQKLESGEMPPKGLPRPTDADRKAAAQWIHTQFDRADAAAKPVAGRVTARRLNRAEYNNTVRGLLAVDFRPADDFPQDDSGYGFDTIGDALSLSPVLMEKYFAAAEKIARTAIFGAEKLRAYGRPSPAAVSRRHRWRRQQPLSLFPALHHYRLRCLRADLAQRAPRHAHVSRRRRLRIPHRSGRQSSASFRPVPGGDLDRWQAGTTAEFEATANPTAMEGLDQIVTVHAPAGEHWIAVSALRLYEGLPEKYGGLHPTKRPEPPAPPQAFAGRGGRDGRPARPPQITDVSFRVNFIEISGPFNANTRPSPDSLNRIFVCREHTPDCERRIVGNLARRAYRRPATPREVTALLALASDNRKRGGSWEESIGVAIQAMLVSPNFLFRIERDPKPGPDGDPTHTISPFELASRLSYFLWSSMPDEELLRCAGQNTLRDPSTLEAQVRRMLRDPKARALVENFGGQWLQFRAIDSVQPDPVRFMAFNDYLRLSMKRETELFFQNLLTADGSIVDFLNGRYSFLNEELARYYGVPGVKGPEFRRVDLEGTHRGGVLTHASVLTASSYATRTSVVLRGKWVLDNLLNAPVPPPPADVPQLDEAAVGTSMSLRRQMEKHRTNTICASCHARMDPLGFGLENFDAIGRWREKDGSFPRGRIRHAARRQDLHRTGPAQGNSRGQPRRLHPGHGGENDDLCPWPRARTGRPSGSTRHRATRGTRRLPDFSYGARHRQQRAVSTKKRRPQLP